MRNLYKHEKKLLNCLLSKTNFYDMFDIEVLKVFDMKDGGMGSLYIVHPQKEKHQRKMGECIAEMNFIDSDGVPISVTLNLDKEYHLFELDIWKVDFTPIKSYPSCL